MRLAVRLCFATLFAAASLTASAATAIAPRAIACKPGQAIDEAGFVTLGGIEQWVTIKGSDCSKPVILFVHGGPGNPNTPYARLPYTAWEQDFTLVQWDQRGAGQTFTRNPATAQARLTIERMAQDGTELAAFLQTHLQQKKVILFGASWGSALGVHMAQARPDLFAAYLGTGQLVKSPDNAIAGYRALMALARAAEDGNTVRALESIGEPPWINPRSFGIMRRGARSYEAKLAPKAPADWMTLAPAHASAEAQAEYQAGEDYSFLQFVGMQGDGMLAALDLPKLGYTFQMPVFLVQGEHDLVTVPAIARAWFDAVKAPHKHFVLLPAVGHDPNPAMVAAQYRILTTRIAPLLTPRGKD